MSILAATSLDSPGLKRRLEAGSRRQVGVEHQTQVITPLSERRAICPIWTPSHTPSLYSSLAYTHTTSHLYNHTYTVSPSTSVVGYPTPSGANTLHSSTTRDFDIRDKEPPLPPLDPDSPSLSATFLNTGGFGLFSHIHDYPSHSLFYF